MSDYKFEEASALNAAASLSIGNTLRHAREARGETLADAAHSLKLAPKQLEALELERFDLLPGRAFVRGFLRNYARHLGLDAEQLIGRLTDSAAVTPTQLDLTPPTNAGGTMPSGGGSASGGSRAITVFVTVLLFVLALAWYFDWFKMSEIGRPGTVSEPLRPLVSEPVSVAPQVDRTPARESAADEADSAPSVTPAPAQTAARDDQNDASTTGAVVNAVATGAGASSADAVAAPPPASAESVKEPGDAPAVLAAATPSTTAAETTTGTTTTASVDPVATKEPAAGQQDAPAVPETTSNEPGQLLFRLRGESWIQVRDASGTTIYMGTGAAGSSRTVQGTPPFAVVVGNATQVTLEHAGKPVDLTPHIRTGVARLTVE